MQVVESFLATTRFLFLKKEIEAYNSLPPYYYNTCLPSIIDKRFEIIQSSYLVANVLDCTARTTNL